MDQVGQFLDGKHESWVDSINPISRRETYTEVDGTFSVTRSFPNLWLTADCVRMIYEQTAAVNC